MVRHPYVDKNGMKKGAWSEEEDDKLRNYILRYGHWNWQLLPKYAGLTRCGKSCRLRWLNYLKPGLRLKNFTQEEGDLIAKLHDELGNKWSAIAEKLPGRTDNEVKNYWHVHIKKHKGKMKATPQVIIEEEEQTPVESEVQIFESSSISDSVNYADLDSADAGDEESVGFWKEPFVMDTSISQDYYFPLLIQEGLLFDQLLNLSDYDFNLL